MNEETRKLFDAPWFPFSRACDFHGLKRSNGSEIFSDASLRSDVNRLARLPELYDALMQATAVECETCSISEQYDVDFDYIFKHGCPRKCKDFICRAEEYIELLKKVRDGE